MNVYWMFAGGHKMKKKNDINSLKDIKDKDLAVIFLALNHMSFTNTWPNPPMPWFMETQQRLLKLFMERKILLPHGTHELSWKTNEEYIKKLLEVK